MAERTRGRPRKVDGGNSGADSPVRSNDGTASGGIDEVAAGSGSVINPGCLTGDNTDGGNDSSDTGGRKRRSDAGNKRGPRTSAGKIDLGAFAQILFEIHSGIAFVTGIAELALDAEHGEPEALAKAIANVARHYPDLPRIEGAALDWLMLLKTLFVIYASRIVAYNMRMRAERAQDVTPNKPVAAVKPAPQPAPQGPPAPPNSRGAFVPDSGVVKANPIPGFEHVPVNVKVN